MPFLDDLGDTAVELAAPLVRKPFVRRVADQSVTEAERASDVGVTFDELAHPIPRLRTRGNERIVLEYVGDERRGERDAQNGRPAQEGAIAGPELIDARRDERLDGLGKLLGLVGLLTDARQLPQEERIARAALHQCGQLLFGQPAVTCCCDGKGSGVLGGERLQSERQGGERRRSFGGRESALGWPSRRTGEPRLRRKLRAEVAKELGRRIVHPVDVVEDQQRWRIEELTEERAHDTVEPCPPEGRVEVAHLGRCLDLDVERGRQEGRPGHELLVDLLEPRCQHGLVVLPAPIQLDVEERTEKGTKRVVGGGRLVLIAAQRDLPHVDAVLAQLLREPRLPDPGLADELDERAEAQPHRRDRRRQDRSLPLAVDKGELLLFRVARRRLGPEAAEYDRLDGLALPLHREGLELRRLEAGAASGECRRRDPHLVFARAGHETRRQCRRVTEHRVRPAKRCANLPREHASFADADVDWEWKTSVDDGPHRAQEALFDVPERLRSAGDEDDPTAVAIHVAFEDRHLMLVCSGLDRAGQHVQRVGGRLGPLGSDHVVDSRETNESDRGVPVLALERPDLQKLGAQWGRDGNLDREPLHVRERYELAPYVGRRSQQSAGSLLVPERVGVE